MPDLSSRSAAMKTRNRDSEQAHSREQAIHARYAALLDKILFEAKQRVTKKVGPAEHRGASKVYEAMKAVIDEFREQ